MSNNTLEMDTVLTFGKHKGSTVEDVAVGDVQYLDWLEKNTDCKLPDGVKIQIMWEAFIEKRSGYDRGYDMGDFET